MAAIAYYGSVLYVFRKNHRVIFHQMPDKDFMTELNIADEISAAVAEIVMAGPSNLFPDSYLSISLGFK